MRQTKHDSETEPAANSRHPGRNALGQFARDNDGHLSTGVHSEKRWAELEPLLREQRANILRAKGFTEEDVDPVFSRVVDAFVQSVTMSNSYFEFLLSTGGPISVKGRTRRAVEGWSKSVDRLHRLAVSLGLERRARSINETPRQWLERMRSATTTDDQRSQTEDDHHDADKSA